MVEGARLESVCTGNRTVGSNPTLSASPSLRSVLALRVIFRHRAARRLAATWHESHSFRQPRLGSSPIFR